MRYLVALFALAVIGIAVWMLIDLRGTTSQPSPATPSTSSANATAPSGPTLARPLPIAAPPSGPTPLTKLTPPYPQAPNVPAPPPVNPETMESDDPAAAPNSQLDSVKMGKTIREWRHYYGERQRAIQQDLYRYEDIMDRESDSTPPSAAELSDARARIQELTKRMRDDLSELKKIETSP
jgi:hypothetical protein